MLIRAYSDSMARFITKYGILESADLSIRTLREQRRRVYAAYAGCKEWEVSDSVLDRPVDEGMESLRDREKEIAAKLAGLAVLFG